MTNILYYFRPGEEARMLARCQFGINGKRECGAILTYPIKGYPWRKNIIKDFTFNLDRDVIATLFGEVVRLKTYFPNECLTNDQLWSDKSEKANAITREATSGILCHTIGTMRNGKDWDEYFSMREDSQALLSSMLYITIARLIAPYEIPKC
ncbi:MAG: hypothetical protein H0W64_12660 [Gammaproteobacteria bacterium]|nr:hypothetical protein [Gammaproteobacteria bacterium]